MRICGAGTGVDARRPRSPHVQLLGHAERTLALALTAVSPSSRAATGRQSTCIEAVALASGGTRCEGHDTMARRCSWPCRGRHAGPHGAPRRQQERLECPQPPPARGRRSKETAAKRQKEPEPHVPDMDVWRWSSVLQRPTRLFSSPRTRSGSSDREHARCRRPTRRSRRRAPRSRREGMIGELQTKAARAGERLRQRAAPGLSRRARQGVTAGEDLDAIVAQGKAAAERAKVLQGEVEEPGARRPTSRCVAPRSRTSATSKHARMLVAGRVPTCGQHIPAELAAVAKAELTLRWRRSASEMAIAVVAAERAEFDRAVRAKSAELDKGRLGAGHGPGSLPGCAGGSTTTRGSRGAFGPRRRPR